MAVKFSNNFSTFLSGGITASDTTITLQSVSGLPTLGSGDHTYLTIDSDTVSPTLEIVKVTAVNTGTGEVTVTRAQDGTTASSFSSGAKVELRLTAILLNDLSYGADETSYDNTASGLVASNVQSAIDELQDKKLNVADLAANVVFYPTSANSDIATYFKLVTSTDDTDYDDPAVDISTGVISGSDQFIAALASEAGILVGATGVISISTVGNVRRVSGFGQADFYFEVYKRDSGGTETLMGTSNSTPEAGENTYEQFFAECLITSTTFAETDRIVFKYYGNRTGGIGDSEFEFQFGGTAPVRSNLPVPVNVVSHANDAEDILVDTGGFSGVLSGSDDDVQAALDTLDGHVHDGRYYTESEIGTFFAGTATITGYNKSNWDTAYGWGDHSVEGYLTGNQTITLSGDVSGSGTTSIVVTVADDSHNHVISNVDGLQTALNAKQDASTALTTSTTFGGDVSGTYNAIVIADDSHNHVISNVDGLQAALDTKYESGDSISVANITATGYLRGPSTFTIDPAAHGDDTGTVVIAGNLQIDGTTTTVNSTTVTIDDLNLTLASGAATASAANGAGITIDGASATIIYNSAGDEWQLNKPLTISGNTAFHDGYHPNADKWTTARTLSLTGAVTGSVSIDGSGNVSLATTATSDPTLTLSGDASGSATFTNLGNATLTVTVADDSHNHIIGNVDGLQTALDAKQNAATAVTTTTTFGGDVSGTYDAIVIADDSHNHVISNVDGLQTALDAKQNASTALTTSTTFGGDVSGTYNAIVVADDSHNHIIGNVDGLQTALDAKLGSTEAAVSADKWTTARTLTLNGDVSGSVSWDGSANATLTVTVADDSHNHTIANIDGLQTALDNAGADAAVALAIALG
jgi:hypothetical protein